MARKAPGAAAGGPVARGPRATRYTGAEPAQAAAEHGIQLSVVQHPEARRGFVLLPRRWVVEAATRQGAVVNTTSTQ